MLGHSCENPCLAGLKQSIASWAKDLGLTQAKSSLLGGPACRGLGCNGPDELCRLSRSGLMPQTASSFVTAECQWSVAVGACKGLRMFVRRIFCIARIGLVSLLSRSLTAVRRLDQPLSADCVGIPTSRYGMEHPKHADLNPSIETLKQAMVTHRLASPWQRP